MVALRSLRKFAQQGQDSVHEVLGHGVMDRVLYLCKSEGHQVGGPLQVQAILLVGELVSHAATVHRLWKPVVGLGIVLMEGKWWTHAPLRQPTLRALVSACEVGGGPAIAQLVDRYSEAIFLRLRMVEDDEDTQRAALGLLRVVAQTKAKCRSQYSSRVRVGRERHVT